MEGAGFERRLEKRTWDRPGSRDEPGRGRSNSRREEGEERSAGVRCQPWGPAGQTTAGWASGEAVWVVWKEVPTKSGTGVEGESSEWSGTAEVCSLIV